MKKFNYRLKRVLVCGARTFKNKSQVFRVLDSLSGIEVVIHGAAAGADSIADEWATMRGLKIQRFPARWDIYGRAAGPIRNREMLTDGKPDFVVAFFRIKSKSRGTANMVQQAKAAGLKVIEFEEE